MFHGNVNARIARGLRKLRERIDGADIPSSALDESLNIATWNIREFGRRRNRRYRETAAIHYIAEIIGQFDIVAVVELRDDLHDLSRVMRILGPYWRVVFSDYIKDWGGNSERIAFIYDRRAADFTGLAGDADPPRRKDGGTGAYLPTLTWYRPPFMASFTAGNFDFVLLAVHVKWGSEGVAGRVPELKLLADWVDKRRKEKHVVDKDFIVLGDFNIPSLNDDAFAAITSKGLRIPEALRGSEHGSNLMRNKRYDQILFHPHHTSSFSNRAGVLDFFQNDWRALFPQRDYPDMDKQAFTYQLSDHLPLWAQLNTSNDDEHLDQIIRRAERRERGRS